MTFIDISIRRIRDRHGEESAMQLLGGTEKAGGGEVHLVICSLAAPKGLLFWGVEGGQRSMRLVRSWYVCRVSILARRCLRRSQNAPTATASYQVVQGVVRSAAYYSVQRPAGCIMPCEPLPRSCRGRNYCQ